MGASAWHHFVPYREDVGRALQELREDVFRRGEYFRARPGEEPASIEALMEANQESGTHSVLDVFGVADAPGWSVAAPLSPEERVRHFGSERPTREQVERSFAEVYRIVQDRGPWTGSYLVVYRDDAPSEIFFFGASGD